MEYKKTIEYSLVVFFIFLFFGGWLGAFFLAPFELYVKFIACGILSFIGIMVMVLNDTENKESNSSGVN